MGFSLRKRIHLFNDKGFGPTRASVLLVIFRVQLAHRIHVLLVDPIDRLRVVWCVVLCLYFWCVCIVYSNCAWVTVCVRACVCVCVRARANGNTVCICMHVCIRICMYVYVSE